MMSLVFGEGLANKLPKLMGGGYPPKSDKSDGARGGWLILCRAEVVSFMDNPKLILRR